MNPGVADIVGVAGDIDRMMSHDTVESVVVAVAAVARSLDKMAQRYRYVQDLLQIRYES